MKVWYDLAFAGILVSFHYFLCIILVDLQKVIVRDRDVTLVIRTQSSDIQPFGFICPDADSAKVVRSIFSLYIFLLL